MADRNIVFPAIQRKLKELGANVADNVVANEQWYDFLLGLLIVPGLLACSNWTISGDALRVEPNAMSDSLKMAGVNRDSMWIFFKQR